MISFEVNLLLNILGPCLGAGASGITFRHRQEPDKVVKILLRAPDESLFQELYYEVPQGVDCLDDYPDEYLWLFCSGWATNQMWSKVSRNPVDWLPKIYANYERQLTSREVLKLLNRADVKSYEGYEDTCNQYFKWYAEDNTLVDFYVVIQEYLPNQARNIEQDNSQRRRQKIVNAYFLSHNMIVRDAVANYNNYLANKKGKTVFFDPLACPLPTKQQYDTMDSITAIAFKTLMITENPTIQHSPRYRWWSRLNPSEIDYYLEALESGKYFTYKDFRSEEVLDNYTPYEIMNSGVVTGNFLQDV